MNHLSEQLLMIHHTYQHYNQEPHGASMRLSELGHPLSRWFQMIQAMFDSLYYCSNAAERVMAYSADGNEQIRLRRPEIREAKGFSFKHNGGLYVMPMPSQTLAYNRFVDDFAAAGFPKSKAHLGETFFTLTIRTSREDVKTEILDLIRNTECLQGSFEHGEIRISLRRKNGGALPPLKHWRTLIAMLRKSFKDSLLAYPAEPPAAKDKHLFDRPFRTGNVQALTITPHAVLVPLLSPSADNTTRQTLAHDIKHLIAQGYPINSNVQAYLNDLLPPAEIRYLMMPRVPQKTLSVRTKNNKFA